MKLLQLQQIREDDGVYTDSQGLTTVLYPISKGKNWGTPVLREIETNVVFLQCTWVRVLLSSCYIHPNACAETITKVDLRARHHSAGIY